MAELRSGKPGPLSRDEWLGWLAYHELRQEAETAAYQRATKGTEGKSKGGQAASEGDRRKPAGDWQPGPGPREVRDPDGLGVNDLLRRGPKRA